MTGEMSEESKKSELENEVAKEVPTAADVILSHLDGIRGLLGWIELAVALDITPEEILDEVRTQKN